MDNLLRNDVVFAFPLVQEEFVEFVIQKLFDEILHGQEVTLVLHSLNAKDKRKEPKLRIALLNSFRHYAEMASYDLTEVMTDGLFAIVVSLMVLIITFAIIIPVAVYKPGESNNPWYNLIYDFLLVFLWVAIWHPFEIIVYGRYMVRFRRDICRTLGNAKITIVPLEKEFIQSGIDFRFEEIEVEEV